MSRTVLIPAAGLGTRVGSPEAKEMLPHPETGEALIAHALRKAQEAKASAHVITRKEKRSLISYLTNKSEEQALTIQLVEPTPEWPATLLTSQAFWAEQNVVCLPDTDFSPDDILQKMFEALHHSAVCFSTFHEKHLSSFGAIEKRNERIFHCEKPNNWSDSATAWGLFGFQREFGVELLQQLLKSTFDHQWRPLPEATEVLPLQKFRDLTRERTR